MRANAIILIFVLGGRGEGGEGLLPVQALSPRGAPMGPWAPILFHVGIPYINLCGAQGSHWATLFGSSGWWEPCGTMLRTNLFALIKVGIDFACL